MHKRIKMLLKLNDVTKSLKQMIDIRYFEGIIRFVSVSR